MTAGRSLAMFHNLETSDLSTDHTDHFHRSLYRSYRSFTDDSTDHRWMAAGQSLARFHTSETSDRSTDHTDHFHTSLYRTQIIFTDHSTGHTYYFLRPLYRSHRSFPQAISTYLLHHPYNFYWAGQQDLNDLCIYTRFHVMICSMCKVYIIVYCTKGVYIFRTH